MQWNGLGKYYKQNCKVNQQSAHFFSNCFGFQQSQRPRTMATTLVFQLLARFKGISNERSRLRHPLHTRSWSGSKIIRLDVMVFTPPTPKILLKFEQHMSDAQCLCTHMTSIIVVHIFTPCIITHTMHNDFWPGEQDERQRML